MNGEFRGRAPTRVGAKLCPNFPTKQIIWNRGNVLFGLFLLLEYVPCLDTLIVRIGFERIVKFETYVNRSAVDCYRKFCFPF